jgi:NADH dehydrogenase [ubiquinone] 1 alpha subcomplex assembly factor 7
MLRQRATPEQAADIDGAVRRLIGETEMGTLFKVLALTGPGQDAPAGFEPPGQP